MTTTIGDRIAYIRGSRSQAAFALEIGAHKNSIGNYERGDRTPDADFLRRIIDAGYSANWVITGEGPMLLKDLDVPAGASSGLDLDLLERVARAAFEELKTRRIGLEPADQARVIRVLYRHFASRGEQPDHDTISNIIDLAAYR